MKYKIGDKVILGTHYYSLGDKYKGQVGTVLEIDHEMIMCTNKQIQLAYPHYANPKLAFIPETLAYAKEYTVNEILKKIDETQGENTNID